VSQPTFTSFDDAWGWFTSGGELTPIGRWRERFAAGRAQLLSFQIPLADLPLASAIAGVQDALLDSPAGEHLVLFEQDMLHISLRAAGFQVITKAHPGDITREDAGRISGAAAKALHGRKPVEASIGPVNVFPDALILEVHDNGALAALRDALAPIVEDAFGLTSAEYLPHVTVAMFRSPAAAAPLRTILPQMRSDDGVAATLREVELTRWWFTGIDEDALPEPDAVRTYRLR
jgi:2'-5' RNA ligase